MNDLSKRNLVAEAVALEANATVAEHAAKSQHADAERWRAEAAKLREQAREPLLLWVNYGAGMPAYAYTSESEARHTIHASMARTRIAVPMVELKPGWAVVKVPSDARIREVSYLPNKFTPTEVWIREILNELGVKS